MSRYFIRRKQRVISTKQSTWPAACVLFTVFLAQSAAKASPVANQERRTNSRVTFESSEPKLDQGFQWAKQQALQYVFSGDPVGEWYEAALPKRDAFCMRDVAHQTLGAQILGLAPVTKNMLRKFVQAISDSRDWCSFWEIDKLDRPAPVDYTNDKDFWYTLPANFDMLHCCYRQYKWTGDTTYLNDPVFRNFYDRTVVDYVKRWDKDGDGIPDSYDSYGRRGIGSYSENQKGRPKTAGDLLSAEYSAYMAYAKMCEIRGDKRTAESYRKMAQSLRSLYNEKWWNEQLGRFSAAQMTDGSYNSGLLREAYIFPLYLEQMPEDGKKLKAALDYLSLLSRTERFGVETRSHLPETFYKWGRDEDGYRTLADMYNPSLRGREYPEVSFSVVGAFAAGMMGITPDAANREVATLPHLVKETSWAAIHHVPVFNNEISVRHTGLTKTQFTNESGPAIQWKAGFPSTSSTLLVDGKNKKAQKGYRLGGDPESYVVLTVQPGQTATVQSPDVNARKQE
jgi:hypothetical protein